MTSYCVQLGDVVDVPSDLLLLKYAQDFYGADRAVADRLVAGRVCRKADMQPKPMDSVVVDTQGVIAPKSVMFLGTRPLGDFDYDEMELFAELAMESIARAKLPVKCLTTTVHGGGYGLDQGESLQRLVTGFRHGLAQHRLTVERIVFVSLGQREARMLSGVLESIAEVTVDSSHAPRDWQEVAQVPGPAPPRREQAAPAKSRDATPAPLDRDARPAPADKGRVFVAMPFSEEFQNVYEYGIYPAVRNCDLICERVDESHFVGDILGRIRDGIESASLVVADLTGSRPNVYLEVGYAWGRGVPVIFVARKGEQLHFDVSGHRCVFYGVFRTFATELEELIRGLQVRQDAGEDR